MSLSDELKALVGIPKPAPLPVPAEPAEPVDPVPKPAQVIRVDHELVAATSLRDEFAESYMLGMVASGTNIAMSAIATLAYQMADEMMKARAQK